jgi:hypothetical protein
MSEVALPPAPFTPETLAVRWDCSPEVVRRLCRSGRLPCFTVGKGMYRIRQADVAEYEGRSSGLSEADNVLSGAKAAKSIVRPVPRIALLPARR